MTKKKQTKATPKKGEPTMINQDELQEQTRIQMQTALSKTLDVVDKMPMQVLHALHLYVTGKLINPEDALAQAHKMMVETQELAEAKRKEAAAINARLEALKALLASV